MDIRPASVTYTWCQKESTAGLSDAVERLYRELPGWWFSLGNCHVSADATVGPDRTGPDRSLLQFAEFDNGIDGSLLHPATLAAAIHNAIDNAISAKARFANDH